MGNAQISIVGTGNIAWHLVQMFGNAGIPVAAIYGRNFQKAAALASLCNGEAKQLNDMNNAPADALVFFAVADDAIRSVASTFNTPEVISVHVSGAVTSEALRFGNNRFGVYYPLQSFSKEVKTDYSVIPVCIVAQDTELQKLLSEIAHTITPAVYTITDEQKSRLHLAAVIANNFTNFLFGQAFMILKEAGLPKEIILPLMLETIEKLKIGEADAMQTGPARRGDIHTLEQHRRLLQSHPELLQLYDVLSKSIRNTFLHI